MGSYGFKMWNDNGMNNNDMQRLCQVDVLNYLFTHVGHSREKFKKTALEMKFFLSYCLLNIWNELLLSNVTMTDCHFSSIQTGAAGLSG